MLQPSRKNLSLFVLNNFVRDALRDLSQEIEDELVPYLRRSGAGEEERLEGLAHTMHFVLMELVGNAVKANLKRLYFHRNGYDINRPESYREGLAAFMAAYQTVDDNDYQAALKELDFQVQVSADLNRDRLLIRVENNATLIAEEERRIRRQLAGSMNAQNIVDFSVTYGDETEGRGLGLAMIVLLIRDMGFDPNNFRVYQDGTRTIARVEFPLSADYRPVRARFEREHPDVSMDVDADGDLQAPRSDEARGASSARETPAPFERLASAELPEADAPA